MVLQPPSPRHGSAAPAAAGAPDQAALGMRVTERNGQGIVVGVGDGRAKEDLIAIFLLRRIDDYMANFLARHYLTRDEMDTYVRNNVGSRLLDYAPERD